MSRVAKISPEVQCREHAAIAIIAVAQRAALAGGQSSRARQRLSAAFASLSHSLISPAHSGVQPLCGG
jgi:hypothetical protein